VLGHLAATQARDLDDARDAEPGKIMHERRCGELAALGEIPFGLYYGSVDATPLFVMLAGAYHARTGDLALAARLWPHVERALDWIDRHGDLDGDGFVEYARRSRTGLSNQGWKDSHDSVFHADGAMAEPPIALCEVQGYVYAARRQAARLAEALGRDDRAAVLRRQADQLRDRFDRAFWCPELGTYALALDGGKRPCRVRSSNAGHALYTGIALPERAGELARTLLDEDAYSGWGIRTVATGAARYNPMSYHNGSVWPHDNAMIAAGLADYGQKEAALRVASGRFQASRLVDLNRLPELFCGFVRRHGEGRRCTRSPARRRRGRRAPRSCCCTACSPYLKVVELLNLRVGDGRVDLHLEHHQGDVGLRVLHRDAPVRINIVK
jgi:glycogen debranching enzyme